MSRDETQESRNEIVSFLRSVLAAGDLDDFEEQRKRYLIAAPMLIGVVVVLAFGLDHLIKGEFRLGIVVVATSILLVCCAVVLRFVKRGIVIYRSITIAITALFLYLLVDGGSRGAFIHWMYVVPIMAFFLLGAREGAVLIMAASILSAVLLLVPLPFMTPFPYDSEIIVRFMASFVIVCFITYNFEVVRQVLQQRLRDEGFHLKESESKYRSLIENLPVGVVVHALDGRIVVSNTKARQMLDLASDLPNSAGAAESGLSFVKEDGDPLPASENPLNQVLSSGRPLRNVVLGIKKNREKNVAWTLVDAFPLSDSPNDERQIVICYGDMTARKQAEGAKTELEELLLQSQKMEAIGRLAGGVAHDINNTLGAIMNSASMLSMEVDRDSPMAEDVGNIISACRKGGKLTQDLLGFARKGKYVRENLSLNDVATRLHGLLVRTIPKAIVVKMNLAEKLALVEGDFGQIENALMNVCINASDAMEGRGELTIATENTSMGQSLRRTMGAINPGRYVCLKVTDTGSGMDLETKRRAFEPFFTTKKEGKGTGLGLSMVYGVVNNHGGMVYIDSAKGRGTTVTMVFPVTDKSTLRRTSVPPVVGSLSSSPGRGCVLLADDEPMVLRATSRILAKMGYEVVQASTGREALDVFRRRQSEIKLVIMDLIMPEMDGLDTFRELRKLDPNAKVILCSGYAKDEKVDEILREGAKGFLQKPFDAAALVAEIER